MNRDETLRLALKAGIDVAFGAAVDRFAAVIAAAEREACAKECDEVCANFYALYKGRPPYTGKENGRGDPIADGASHGAEKCAAAIRARGQA